jgi:hypothetical protein
MDEHDRIYFASRAAEEQELASSATDPEVAEAHRKMQRAYLERASIGARPANDIDPMPAAGAPHPSGA